MCRLDNKVSIVTGSTRGIGKDISLEIARRGAKVVISGRDLARAEEVKGEIENKGGKAIVIPADVSKSEEAQNLINKTLEIWDQIDILVNNAGITKDNLIMRMPETDWDEVINVNLKGTFNCIKSVTRQMMKQRSGRIINITSVVGLMGNPGQSNYAASKAGIVGLTKSIARELSSRNITCNAIAPGYIETEMTKKLDQKIKEALKERIPLGRLGQGKDVAKLAAFLASEDASYITGQVFNVDGGMLIA